LETSTRHIPTTGVLREATKLVLSGERMEIARKLPDSRVADTVSRSTVRETDVDPASEMR